MFTVFLLVSVASLAYGIVWMFNLWGAADSMTRYYAGLPRWYPKAMGRNPKLQRVGGAVAAGFGLALLLVDLFRFR
jgi:hypothetical protein